MSSGWGEQPASESSPEPVAGSGSAAEGAAGGGAAGGGGVLVPVLIIVVVLLVLGGGAAAFLLLRPDRSSAGGGPSVDTPTPIPVSSSSAPDDSPTPEAPPSSEAPEPPAAAPANLAPPQITGTVTVGELLTTTHGTWQDQAGLQFGVAWASCGSMESKTCVVVSGANNDTYVVNSDDEGKYLLSVVTAFNAAGGQSQVQSGTVGPAAPAQPTTVLVPAVVNKKYSTAVALADQAGLTILWVGYSGGFSATCDTTVTTQDPPDIDPPAQLQVGEKIQVTTTRPPKNCYQIKYPTKVQVKKMVEQPGG